VGSHTANGRPSATEAMALLHIGGEHTAVVSGGGEKPDTTHTLGIGALRVARTYFHHDPPTSLEIELSIAAVEEEVTPLILREIMHHLD
jgi:exopolyphosphatase/pppGpp-phosphohydrolase